MASNSARRPGTIVSPSSLRYRWASSIPQFRFGGAFTLLFIIEHLTIGRPAGSGDPHRTVRVASTPWTFVILVGTLFLCFAIGMPISYSLGVGALAGALWIGIPPKR